MAGEEWARQIIERELGQPVFIHDDGRIDSMYDLRIGPNDNPLVAIEVVGAVDREFTETWNVGPARGSFTVSVNSNWIITVSPKARIKTVKGKTERILQKLETQSLYDVRTDYRLKRYDRAIFDELESLGIERIYCYLTQGVGKVYLSMSGTGGAVDAEGSTIPEWASSFLNHPAQQDVLYKLNRSAASACHVFILLSFKGAPWSIESYFTTELEHLPSEAPELPLPVSEVWLAHPWNYKGLRWDGTAWRVFDARKNIESLP